jgi:hypothetical protein
LHKKQSALSQIGTAMKVDASITWPARAALGGHMKLKKAAHATCVVLFITGPIPIIGEAGPAAQQNGAKFEAQGQIAAEGAQSQIPATEASTGLTISPTGS